MRTTIWTRRQREDETDCWYSGWSNLHVSLTENTFYGSPIVPVGEIRLGFFPFDVQLPPVLLAVNALSWASWLHMFVFLIYLEIHVALLPHCSSQRTVTTDSDSNTVSIACTMTASSSVQGILDHDVGNGNPWACNLHCHNFYVCVYYHITGIWDSNKCCCSGVILIM